MKVGFFGGSFNPPTIAHYNLIKQAKNDYKFDEVYFVPVNDFYGKIDLINIDKRIDMLNLVCKLDDNIKVLEIEKRIPKKLNAIDIFQIIENNYINDDIYFFMGEDNYKKMSDWKDYDKLQKYNYIIFQRYDKKEMVINSQNVLYMKNPENLKVSSSQIRKKLQNNENISDLVCEDVEKYIINNKLYVD